MKRWVVLCVTVLLAFSAADAQWYYSRRVDLHWIRPDAMSKDSATSGTTKSWTHVYTGDSLYGVVAMNYNPDITCDSVKLSSGQKFSRLRYWPEPMKVEAWGLVAPTKGSQTVTAYFSGTITDLVVIGYSLQNVNQSIPIQDLDSLEGNSNTPYVISPRDSNLFVLGISGDTTLTTCVPQSSYWQKAIAYVRGTVKRHVAMEYPAYTGYLYPSWVANTTGPWRTIAIRFYNCNETNVLPPVETGYGYLVDGSNKYVVDGNGYFVVVPKP